MSMFVKRGFVKVICFHLSFLSLGWKLGHVLWKRLLALAGLRGCNFPITIMFYPTFSFADDVIVIGKGNEASVHNLGRLLRGFFLISRLRVNLSKSAVYGVGISNSEFANISSILHSKVGLFPFTYLGLKAGVNTNNMDSWTWNYPTDLLFWLAGSRISYAYVIMWTGQQHLVSVECMGTQKSEHLQLASQSKSDSYLLFACKKECSPPSSTCLLCGDETESVEHHVT